MSSIQMLNPDSDAVIANPVELREPRSRGRVGVLATLLLLGACATARTVPSGPPPSMESDDVGRAGVNLFQAGYWREAHEPLWSFIETHCREATNAECDRAIGMLFQGSLNMGSPAQVLSDYVGVQWLRRNARELNPPLIALRQQARQALRAAWDSNDRSASLHVDTVLGDVVGESCPLQALAYSLDTGPPVSAIPEGYPSRVRALDFSVPAGSHLLEFVVICRASAGRGSKYRVRSWFAFTLSPGEKGRATVALLKAGTDQMIAEIEGLRSPLKR